MIVKTEITIDVDKIVYTVCYSFLSVDLANRAYIDCTGVAEQADLIAELQEQGAIIISIVPSRML